MLENPPPPCNPDYYEPEDVVASAPPIFHSNNRHIMIPNSKSTSILVNGKCMSGKTTYIQDILKRKNYNKIVVLYMDYKHFPVEYDKFNNCTFFSSLPNRGFFDDIPNSCMVIEDLDMRSININALEKELWYFKSIGVNIYIACQLDYIPSKLKRIVTRTIQL
jgi:hypothetical protein